MSEATKELPSDSTGLPGEPRTTKSRILEGGAAMAQDFTPVKQICAHLHAFHVYADDPTRCVEANHYCTHLNEGKICATLGLECNYPSAQIDDD